MLTRNKVLAKAVSCKSLINHSATDIGTAARQFHVFRASFSCLHSKNVGKPAGAFGARAFHNSAPRLAQDYYEILGVGKDAKLSDIKKKYYELAKKYHPDVNKEAGSKEKFHKIQEAYDTLSDQDKRSNYDQFGTADPSQGFPGGGGGFGGGFPGGFPGGGFQGGFSGGFPSMDEIFSQIFGNQAGGRTRRTRSGGPQTRGSFSDIGEDIQQSIRITFNEAVNGAKKTISTTPVTECTTCHGNGVKAGAKSVVCPGCKGTGHQVYSLGGFHVQQTCEKCHGSGEAIDKRDVCGSCDGAGVVRGRESVQVEIPAGCEDGMILEVRNKGDAPIEGKGPRGKLLVLIRVTPSPIFVRKGSDVYYTADIPLTTALLGGEITMPTVSGNVDVKIKSGAQPGDELRLRGKGTKKVRGTGHGDFYVKLKINIPTKLTPEQQDLVRKLDDSLNNRSSSSESSCSSSHRSGSDKSAPESTKDTKHEGFFSRLRHNLNPFDRSKKK